MYNKEHSEKKSCGYKHNSNYKKKTTYSTPWPRESEETKDKPFKKSYSNSKNIKKDNSKYRKIDKNKPKRDLSKIYPNNSKHSAREKEYLRRKYNVHDNTLSIVIHTRLNSGTCRLNKTTFYFEFEHILSRECIESSLQSSLMSAMMVNTDINRPELSDRIIKKVEIIASRKFNDVIKTYILPQHIGKEYFFVYKLLEPNEGILHTKVKY